MSKYTQTTLLIPKCTVEEIKKPNKQKILLHNEDKTFSEIFQVLNKVNKAINLTNGGSIK